MQRLFLFLYQYRAFLTFLVLEVLCSWLIIENNTYQGAKFFNSSNRVAAGLLQTSNNITNYFSLTSINEDLAKENAELKTKLRKLNQSIFNPEIQIVEDGDIINKYEFKRAKVINNSTRRFNNYITVDRGSKEGIEPDMAVIDNYGVVGKVKSVSKHFSVITSILHSDVLVSSKIKRTGDLCTTKWGGQDPYTAKLQYVPLHVDLQEGDTIVTSGYNAVFPENVPVGVIKAFEVRDDALFYDVDISLAGDLNRLSYVYIIKNKLKIEQDSVEAQTIEVND